MSEQDSERMAVALRQDEPFTPIRSTEDLIDMLARQVVGDIEREYARHVEGHADGACARCELGASAWDLAREYAHHEINAARESQYRGILSLYREDVIYFNHHELRLLAQLAESLELPR